MLVPNTLAQRVLRLFPDEFVPRDWHELRISRDSVPPPWSGAVFGDMARRQQGRQVVVYRIFIRVLCLEPRHGICGVVLSTWPILDNEVELQQA